MKISIIVWALLHLGTALFAFPSRPYPPKLVNDFAEILTPGQTMDLEHKLTCFNDTTSNQITVVTVPSLEGYSSSEYATRIGLEWGVGSEKFDNGIVVLVKPKTRESMGDVFIAVGYGLEGAIPDAYCKRIIEDIMIPYFKENNYYAGVDNACDTLMKLASGEITELAEQDDIATLISFISLILIIIVILIIIKGKGSGNGNGSIGRGRTIFTGPVIIRGNGGWGSGGSSFGGFGGGSFGGGGAGGRW